MAFSARAPKANSKLLIKLERQIGVVTIAKFFQLFAIRIQGAATMAQNVALRIRNAMIKSSRIVGQKVTVSIAFCRRAILWVTAAVSWLSPFRGRQYDTHANKAERLR